MDRVLYFLGNRKAHPASERGLSRALAKARRAGGDDLLLSFEHSVERTLAKLRSGGTDALLIDARDAGGCAGSGCAIELLNAVFDDDVDGAISRQRTWMLIDAGARGNQLAFEAGRLRLAGTLTRPTTGPTASAGDMAEDLWELVYDRIRGAAASSRSGRIALCLAGGGTEGLLYELGVLRAIQEFLPDFNLSNVDLICGISAGAILGSLLANGLQPDSISQGLRGRDRRVDPITRADLFDLNVRGLMSQASRLSGELWRGERSPMSALFRLPPAGLFAGQRLEAWLKRQLTRPGMKNEFDELQRKLFIGATQQDSGQHVVFGEVGAPRVRIHEAVRASIALAPFYAPALVDGNYYIDGAFTRTTNTRVAVRHGSTMVLVIEPLVPISSNRTGYVADRGAIYTAAQGLKSLVNARFAKAMSTLRSMYPEVSFHLFQPNGASLRMLSGSPMKFWYREELEHIAYQQTMHAIRAHAGKRLARDFQRHGVRFLDPDLHEDHAPGMPVVRVA